MPTHSRKLTLLSILLLSLFLTGCDLNTPEDVNNDTNTTGGETTSGDTTGGDTTGGDTTGGDTTGGDTTGGDTTGGDTTGGDTTGGDSGDGSFSDVYVADYQVATEAALRAIPDSYIDAARTNLHIAYNHTSHGTHVSYGIYGLPGFKSGDADKFGLTMNSLPDPNRLDFHDNEIGGAFPDLSQADADWVSWRYQVRNYLDDPSNADINVMMWSWCNIAGHSVPDYLSSMQTLIDEYGPGGSKIGSGVGYTRTTPVTFIFMTGHANEGSNVGDGNPREQAALITDYCNTHGYYCIDYYSIDTHTMDGTYYEDTGDDGNSASYGGNFYQDWQTSHTLGVDWYENRYSPGGTATYGAHNSQHITANRKAFAFWWVLARISGYE